MQLILDKRMRVKHVSFQSNFDSYIVCFYAVAIQDILFDNLKNHNLFTEKFPLCLKNFGFRFVKTIDYVATLTLIRCASTLIRSMP